MGFARTAVGLSFIAILLFYLSTVGELTDEAKWVSVGLMTLLSFMWIKLGSPTTVTTPRPQLSKSQPVASTKTTVSTEEEAEDDDVPAPVRSNDLDGATLRERKLAKIAAANAANHEGEVHEDIPMIEVEVEDVHVADEFVVEVTPESIEDADIELTVQDRRKRHDEIRERIERRRRGQMADIRASTAKMWEEHAAGEDLVALLQTPGHGHSVMVQPEHPEPGHVYGATFIRIDEARILKLRLPLDEGFESATPTPVQLPTLPPLIGADGKELPPLIGPDGLPLPLPPLPQASVALSALRDEMAE